MFTDSKDLCRMAKPKFKPFVGYIDKKSLEKLKFTMTIYPDMSVTVDQDFGIEENNDDYVH